MKRKRPITEKRFSLGFNGDVSIADKVVVIDRKLRDIVERNIRKALDLLTSGT